MIPGEWRMGMRSQRLGESLNAVAWSRTATVFSLHRRPLSSNYWCGNCIQLNIAWVLSLQPFVSQSLLGAGGHGRLVSASMNDGLGASTVALKQLPLGDSHSARELETVRTRIFLSLFLLGGRKCGAECPCTRLFWLVGWLGGLVATGHVNIAWWGGVA